MKKFQIGIYEKAIPEEYPLRQMLEITRKHDYDFFEISIDRTEARINRLYDDVLQNELLGACINSDVYAPIRSMCLSALSTYTLGNSDVVIEQRAKDIFTKSIVFAERIGIRIIQIPACDMPKSDVRNKDTDRRFIDNLKEMVELASAHGVLVALENMENDYMDTISKCMRIIREVDSPYLQMYPDAGNLTSASVLNQTDIADEIYGGGRYVAFHLKETKPGKYGGLFYGDGHVDFEQIVRSAWKAGVRRYALEYWYTGNPDWEARLDKARELCLQWIQNAQSEVA